MLNDAVKICRLLIGERVSITDEDIDSSILQATSMPIFKDVDTLKLKNELLAIYCVRVSAFKILEARERREPWIKNFKAIMVDCRDSFLYSGGDRNQGSP